MGVNLLDDIKKTLNLSGLIVYEEFVDLKSLAKYYSPGDYLEEYTFYIAPQKPEYDPKNLMQILNGLIHSSFPPAESVCPAIRVGNRLHYPWRKYQENIDVEFSSTLGKFVREITLRLFPDERILCAVMKDEERLLYYDFD